uniref:Uncharacterized protein n=1 Tax=Rhizophora mucronata TaxID=61149 RepID=A0A2P2PKH4_RHIMU
MLGSRDCLLFFNGYQSSWRGKLIRRPAVIRWMMSTQSSCILY